MKAKIILSDHEKKRNRLINTVKKSISELERMDYKIEIDKDVENMMGALVNNVYLVSRIGTRVCLQKHLFTTYN